MSRACPVLGAYHAAIDQILADDIYALPKQRHTMMQVYRRQPALATSRLHA